MPCNDHKAIHAYFANHGVLDVFSCTYMLLVLFQTVWEWGMPDTVYKLVPAPVCKLRTYVIHLRIFNILFLHDKE